MSKAQLEKITSKLSPVIPELAEEILKSPHALVFDRLITRLGSCFHLRQKDVLALRRAVNGHELTRFSLPEPPTYKDLFVVRKEVRAFLRASWDRVQAIWVGLHALSQFYGIPLGSRDLRASASLMFVLAMCHRLEEWYKWVTCHISAWCLGERDLPEKAFPLNPFQIWAGFRKWLKRVVPSNRVGTPWAASIGWSVLQSKRSALALDEKLVERARNKHRSALTQSTPWAPRVLEEEVARTVREVFVGTSFKSRVPIPSSSAHYQTPRSCGGAARAIWNLHLRASQGDYLEAMYEVRPGRVVEVRTVLPMEEIVARFASMRLDGGAAPFWDADFLDRGKDTLPVENICRVSAILEALKVRMITCGNEERYWRAHDLARYMRKTLSVHPVFQLTRGVPLESALPFVLDSCLVSEACGSRPYFVSGDYSAATDNLKESLSRRALREVCACAGLLNWSSYERDLVDHLLDYEDGIDDPLEQRNGQLMGSPDSFPILCLINAAVTRHVLERVTGRRIPLRKSGMLVNGDDILFTLRDRSQYEVWKRFVTLAGLSPSAGKNYFLRDYAVINSQCYRIEYDSSPCGLLEPMRAATAHPVYHLAIGNFRGQGRVLDSRARLLEKMGRPTSVGDNVNLLLARAGPKGPLAFKLLLRANDNFSHFGAVDWFLPKTLGGLGIHPRFRDGGPDIQKLIWADYLVRESRSFQLWRSEPKSSIGAELRAIDERDFYEKAGYSQRFGLSKRYGENDVNVAEVEGYVPVSGGLATLALSYLESGKARSSDPEWVAGSDLGSLYPRVRGSGSRLDSSVRACPRQLRAQAFFGADTREDGDPEEENPKDGIETRDWKRTWERAQKNCPRVRQMRSLSKEALREVECLLWSLRYDWVRPERERREQTPQLNSTRDPSV